jgi:hypothetical protein
MWMLIVLVASLTGVNVQTVDQYVTEDDCRTHKEKFELEFTIAYPGDRDWAFACVLPKQP